MLEKSLGMTTPRPDYKRDLFELPFDTGRASDFPSLFDVVNGMNFACLLIKAMSDKASLAKAENQACRAGTTLVSTHRQILAKTRPED